MLGLSGRVELMVMHGEVNPPIAKAVDPQQVFLNNLLNRFFQFFSDMGKLFLKTKFFHVGSSLGHLSMEKFFRSDPPSSL